MKRTLAALASLALIPATAAAWTVKAPHPGMITLTTYSSSGSFHGAVDLRPDSGICGDWGVETSVMGSLSWNVTIRMTEGCYGSESGNQNEVKHVWADGYSFRVWNFIKTSASFDRTCDRCVIGGNGGLAGQDPHGTHVQYDKSGTRDTSWYSGYTTRGEVVDRTETLGVF
jgi:hypothetical protein